MRTTLGSSLLSAAIAALLWIIISFATGGGVLFSLGGGIACGVVVFIIGYAVRRLVFDRHHAASGSPRLSAASAGRERVGGLAPFDLTDRLDAILDLVLPALTGPPRAAPA
jgi:hypothetical protein